MIGQSGAYQLIEMDKFISTLEAADEIAVEATCNTQWFSEQIAERVRRERGGQSAPI